MSGLKASSCDTNNLPAVERKRFANRMQQKFANSNSKQTLNQLEPTLHFFSSLTFRVAAVVVVYPIVKVSRVKGWRHDFFHYFCLLFIFLFPWIFISLLRRLFRVLSRGALLKNHLCPFVNNRLESVMRGANHIRGIDLCPENKATCDVCFNDFHATLGARSAGKIIAANCTRELLCCFMAWTNCFMFYWNSWSIVTATARMPS